MDVGWTTSAYRTFANMALQCNETKDATLDFFRSTMNDAYEMSLRYSKDKDNTLHQQFLQLILEGMEQSIKGIKNTGITYKDHIMYIGKLETLIDTIRIQIKEVKNRVPEIALSTDCDKKDDSDREEFNLEDNY